MVRMVYEENPFLWRHLRSVCQLAKHHSKSPAPLIRNHWQSATALGATWDTSLVEQAGLKILAQEAKLRAVSVILAPTCNIQRVSRMLCNLALLTFQKKNPLGGRVSPSQSSKE